MQEVQHCVTETIWYKLHSAAECSKTGSANNLFSFSLLSTILKSQARIPVINIKRKIYYAFVYLHIFLFLLGALENGLCNIFSKK